MPAKSPFPGMDPYLEQFWGDVHHGLNGRYDTLDYRAEPMPPLSPADAAWADELLRTTGRR